MSELKTVSSHRDSIPGSGKKVFSSTNFWMLEDMQLVTRILSPEFKRPEPDFGHALPSCTEV
jgi:hypothetical protein